MTKTFVKRFISLIGFLISIGFIWFIIKKYDLAISWKIVKTTNSHFLLLMVLTYLSTFYFRTLRWKLMLINFPKYKFITLLKCIILGFAGNNIIPARGGELLRMEYFSRKTNISRTSSLTSVGLEKILDALILLAFLLCASGLIKEKNNFLVNSIHYISFIFIPIFTFLLVLRFNGTSIIKWLDSSSRKIIQICSKHFVNFYSVLSFLKADFNTLKILGISILIWLLEGLVFVFGLKAIGLNDSVFLMGIIALCIVNFGILVPSSPGYIGIFQAAVIIALSSFKIPETKSLAAAIIIHGSQFFPITAICAIILSYEYFFLNKRNKRNYEQKV